MKRFVIAGIAALLVTSQTAAAGWIKSVDEAQKRAKKNHQLILVDMYADWCAVCHRMEQEVFPSQAFQKATDGMVLLRLNTEDGADGSMFAQKFDASLLPTFLVLTPELYLAGSIQGYYPASEFAELVGKTETGYRDFKKRVASEASIRDDYQKRFELAREFTAHRELDKALSRFRALRDDPRTPASIRDGVFYEMAIAQALRSQWDEVVKTLNAFSAVQSAGEYFEISRILLAQVELQQGNTTAAMSELRAFRTRFPNSRHRANAEGMLAKLEGR